MSYPKCRILLLVSCLLALPAFAPLHALAREGTISSNGSPPYNPEHEPKVPGEIRLSCTLHAGHYVSEADPADGSVSTHISSETTLEYFKKEGKSNFECVSGCEKPVWKKFHREGDPRNLILPSNERNSETYFPHLSMRPFGEKFLLQINIYASLLTRAGTTMRDERTITADSARGEIYAEARLNERTSDLYSADLHKRAKETGQRQFQNQSASVELRCKPLKAGALSETEIARLFAMPPREGSISYDAYHEANNVFSHPEMSFAAHLEQAKRIDPYHLKAELAKISNLLPNVVPVLRARVIPKLQELLARDPNATVEQALNLAGNLLGYTGLSPSATIVLSALPLVMASQD